MFQRQRLLDPAVRYTQRIRNYTGTEIDVEIRRSFPAHVTFRSRLEPRLYDYQTVKIRSSVPAGEERTSTSRSCGTRESTPSRTT